MSFDQKKLARQHLGIERIKQRFADPRTVLIRDLLVSVRAALFEAVTGFGKTLVAILLIQDMNQRKPDRDTIVVVPNLKLYEDWTRTKQTFDDKGKLVADYGHIVKHNLLNVRVFVVNTYTQYEHWKCDFLVLDEVHRYASKDALFFSKVISITSFRFGLGLSATLSKEQKTFLGELGWDVVDTIDKAEAEREGYIVKSQVYNLGIPLDEAAQEFNISINKKFNDYFQKFSFNLDLMKACSMNDKAVMQITIKEDKRRGLKEFTSRLSGIGWRQKWGSILHVDPKVVQIYATQGMRAMGQRRDMWQNYEGKLPYVKQLIDKFPTIKAIIFTESSEFADTITRMLGKSAVSYHTKIKSIAYREGEIPIHAPSKDQIKFCRQNGWLVKGPTVIKREALEAFQSSTSGVNQLVTVRAVDEGYDNDKVGMTVQVAYNSTKRQRVQRSGRADRIDYENLDKTTLTISFYMKGTQERKWLESAQEDDERVINEVESIDEINLNEKVVLYVPEDDQVNEAEAGTFDNSNSGGNNTSGGSEDKAETSI